MTRRARRKAVLCAAVALALVAAFTVSANAWVDGAHCKAWYIGTRILEICLDVTYGTQPDGDGMNAEVVELFVIRGCGLLEPSGGTLTRMHAYTSYAKFPHLPYRDKAVSPAYGCFPKRTINLYGPDRGATRFQLNAHVRVDNWSDKNPVWVVMLSAP